MVLDNNELKNITGGSSKILWGILAAIGGIGTFLIGFIDGFIRPLSCND